MSAPVHVLAVMDGALRRLWDSIPERQVWTREQLDADEELKEARASVAELIEAAQAATEEKYHDGASSRAACDRLVAALSRCRGEA